MDIGRIFVCLIILIYFLRLFIKTKKKFYLFGVFIAFSSMISGGKYNIYRSFSPTIRLLVDMICLVLFLILIIYCLKGKQTSK
ncbi:MAG: hypothetical protein RSA29_14450 [Clostridium sp.]|uniref:hypothetical protein n=1 Tax=Clostridium sp. TaxID=1506 RepID=UPI003217B235